MNQSQLESETVLRKAFDFYDEDKNDRITMMELKKVFGNLCTDEQIRDIIKEVDLDKDNEISFPEFQNMMKLINNKASKFQASWSLYK